MTENSVHILANPLMQDRKRERDQRHKWSRGQEPETAGCTKIRPSKYGGPRVVMPTSKPKRRHLARYDDIPDPTTDESYEDKLDEAVLRSRSPPDAAAYTYSFDAPRGPTEGSQVLGTAITKALENYETVATEKLIKTEYEVISQDKETEQSSKIVEDDFELV